MLKSATVANEALQAQAAAAQRELSAALDAAAAAASHQQRAAAAEKAADEARKELQAAQASAAAIEERLQAAEEEMDRITGMAMLQLSAMTSIAVPCIQLIVFCTLVAATLKSSSVTCVKNAISILGAMQGQWRKSGHGARRLRVHMLRSWKDCRSSL